MIDWETFSARVQAGTRVQFWSYMLGVPNMTEIRSSGVLIENYPYGQWELAARAGILGEGAMRLRFQPIDSLTELSTNAKYLLYLIDGRWLSYDELMA